MRKQIKKILNPPQMKPLVFSRNRQIQTKIKCDSKNTKIFDVFQPLVIDQDNLQQQSQSTEQKEFKPPLLKNTKSPMLQLANDFLLGIAQSK